MCMYVYVCVYLLNYNRHCTYLPSAQPGETDQIRPVDPTSGGRQEGQSEKKLGVMTTETASPSLTGLWRPVKYRGGVCEGQV